MKLTKQTLQKIIREEVEKVFAEGHGFPDDDLYDEKPLYRKGHADGMAGEEPNPK